MSVYNVLILNIKGNGEETLSREHILEKLVYCNLFSTTCLLYLSKTGRRERKLVSTITNLSLKLESPIQDHSVRHLTQPGFDFL